MAPQVTVIVPARNAAATLPATLRALAAQDFAGEIELIVVDNASTDGTAALAEAAGATVLRNQDNVGVAASRNRGAAAATAELLAFTDADCVPVPGWLGAGVAALAAGADLVQGAVTPPVGTVVGPWDRTLSIGAETGLYETASLFVRRTVLEAAGGFPEQPPAVPGPWPGADESPFGEDARFAWKARERGARTGFAPDAVVRHAVFSRSAGAFVADRRRLRYFPTLIRDVPALRARLVLGCFHSWRTLAFDTALAGVLVALLTRRAAPLVAAAPYAVMARPRRGRGHPLADCAVEIAADLTGAAALAHGSIAARRAVL